MTAPITKVERIDVQDYGVDFLDTPRGQWLPDVLPTLVPERDYAPAAAKRCMRAGSIVVGEVANEYQTWVEAQS